MTRIIQVRLVPKLMLATALIISSANAPAATTVEKQINWMVTDSVNNRLILELADITQGCGNANVPKQQFMIDPGSSNYNAVVSAATAAFVSGKKVKIGHVTCATNYAYKINDIAVCGATCPP